MGLKDLERLVGLLYYMHRAVPGLVAHLFHIQHALTQGGVYREWLSPDFQHRIADWRALALQAVVRPTHLYEIVHSEPTHLGFCDASGLEAGEVWLNPDQMVHNLVWCNPWPPDIITDLVSSTNLQGKITNYDLELATLVIHESPLLEEVSEACMAAPHSGLHNNPTISCRTHESLTINPVVAGLLRIRALNSRVFFLNHSVF